MTTEPIALASIVLHFGASELRITPGALVKAEEVLLRGKLRRVWPRGRLLEPCDGDAGYSETAEWELPFGMYWGQVFVNVPQEVLATVARFASHQWHMLEFANNHSPYLDLVRSNPVLAYALACSDELRSTTPESVAKRAAGYVERKQREIVHLLGFPATAATVRMLQRMAPEAANPSLLRILQSCLPLPDKLAKAISHMRVLNAGVLTFLTRANIRTLITPKLLEELAGCADELASPPTADLVFDAMRMGEGLADWRGVPPLRSREQVRELHDMTLLRHLAEQERIRRRQEERRERERRAAEARVRRAVTADVALQNAIFPAPPIAGIDTIVPILSGADLRLEGITQKNCVYTRAEYILKGKLYVYRVTAPERATLAIASGKKGIWLVAELLKKTNVSVSEKTRAHVNSWLTMAQAGKQARWDDTPF